MKQTRWEEVFPHWRDAIRPSQKLHPYFTEGPRDLEEIAFAQRVEGYPKTELHLHAEAAVWPWFYDQFNEKKQVFAHENMPARRVPFAEFSIFVRAWLDNLSFADSSSFYRALAIAIARRCADQNITYAEVHFSPLDSSCFRQRCSFGGAILELESNVQEFFFGIQEAQQREPQVQLRAIVDRTTFVNPAEDEQLFQCLKACVDSPLNRLRNGERILVAIGMGGAERREDMFQQAAALEKFRTLGLKIDIHSGEQACATTVEQRQMDILAKPDRVGHGFRGFCSGYRFPGHVAMCPLSNVLTGCFLEDFSKHPIKEMFLNNDDLSINTDDPLLFGTTLTLEYVALRRAFGFGWDFFLRTQEQARRARFADV